jgi:4-amino-4-deoxy-L-arabinose transferase-like glycosyltransferase
MMKDIAARISAGVRRRPLRACLLLCLLVNGAVLAGIAARNPGYLGDYRLNDSPDARHYVLLGRNLLLEGHYSRQEGPPFAPDFLRTPVYPLVAGALDIVAGPVAIYLLQIGLHLAVVWLVFGLAERTLGRRPAFWAALLMALDLMLAVYNHAALTEPLFLALSLAAVFWLLPRLLSSPGESTEAFGWPVFLGAGSLMALATLTRPAGVYLPLLAAIASLWFLRRRSGWRGAARAAALVLLPSVVLVGAWVLRNERAFGVARVSSVEPVGVVYMAGAGAYQLHHGVERPEAQRTIAAAYDLPTLLEAQNPWLTELSEAEIDHRLRAASREVLGAYPGDLVLSSALGLVKGSLSHNVGNLASLHDRSWTPPGLGGLLKLRAEAVGRLFSNHPALVGAFGWQVAHAILTLVLAVVGLWRLLLCRARRPLGISLLVLLAYFALGMALFGVDAYFRSRIPLLPYLAVLAGVAVAALVAGPLPVRGAPTESR